MPQTQPGWSRVEIAGTPADVFAPESPRFGLLWLHGQDEASAAENATLTGLLKQHRLPCVAPRGGQSWWLGSTEEFLLNEVRPWMQDRWGIASRSIAVAGIEMGGQGALRLALKHPQVFPVAAGLGSAVDFHELFGRGTPLDALFPSRERARQDTATLHMHPTEWPAHLWFACDPIDPWYRGNDRLSEKLRAYGVPHTADLDSSGSDYFDAMLSPMLDFITQGLERESRRLM
jgi:S-formylglutathione hydrolase FrmB